MNRVFSARPLERELFRYSLIILLFVVGPTGTRRNSQLCTGYLK